MLILHVCFQQRNTMFTDHQIIEYVFPQHCQAVLYLLTTDENAVEKAVNCYKKSKESILQDNGGKDIGVTKLFQLLQKEISFPEVEGKHFVFFSLSRRTQHNLLRFMEEIGVDDRFSSFLRVHKALLDPVGRILFVRISDTGSTEIILSASAIARLEAMCIGEENIFHKIATKEKQKILKSSEADNIFQKSAEQSPETPSDRVAFETHAEAKTFDREPTERGVVDNENDQKQQLSEKMECAQQAANEDADENIFEDEKMKRKKSYNMHLKITNLDEESKISKLSELVVDDTLSLENKNNTIFKLITEPIIHSNESPSRLMNDFLVDICSEHSHIACRAILFPILVDTRFSDIHADIIKKLITTNELNLSILSDTLTLTFASDHLKLTEAFLLTVENILQRKPPLGPVNIGNILNHLKTGSGNFVNSNAFMKVVIAIMTNYATVLSGYELLLQALIQMNNTFLKKSALKIMSNLTTKHG